MSNINDNEKAFIDEVWKKVRYVEYTRAQEGNKEANLALLKRKKIKSLLSFASGLTLMFVPLLILGDFNELFVASIGIYLMGFALYYEYKFN